MLNIDSALEIMNKYGYSSITSHPYIYQTGESLGVCYSYVDEDYGKLERIKICKTDEDLEEFLKAFSWVEKNGKQRHVRMILDNYESYNPKVIFLRNERIMVEGEMYDIDSYDRNTVARQSMDQTSKIIYEAGDLLLVYNEMKKRQQSYLKSLVNLKNSLRSKYFDLQKEVDTYNRIKLKRELVLLPDAIEDGINETLEMSIKDRYNKYIVQMPDIKEAETFLKEVWDLNYTLEMNSKYYDAIREDSAIRNEMKVVEQKIDFMKELNDDIKPLFGADLVAHFQKINKKAEKNNVNVSEETVNMAIESVKRKYSYYEKLDPLYTSDFLGEAIQNTNYEDLAFKYAMGASPNVLNNNKTPLNEIAADLTVKYKSNLSIDEQAILVLYNNEKYRKIFDVILSLPNFETLATKDIVKSLGSIKNLSKLKSECYEVVKKRIDVPDNATIKSSLFNNVDFTTFETFIASLVSKLSLIRNVNERLVLTGDINMFLTISDINDLNLKNFMTVTNDVDSLVESAKKNNEMVGITLLKANTPVLYSPYYFDLGDTFSKNASPVMYIKEMVDFNLLVDLTDVLVNIDPNKTNVVAYDSVTELDGNLTLVKDLHAKYSSIFCKYALTKKTDSVQMDPQIVVEQKNDSEETVQNVVSQ